MILPGHSEGPCSRFCVASSRRAAPAGTLRVRRVRVCRIKYYNNCLFHNIQKNFLVQTGDPTGTGKGGDSVYKCVGKPWRPPHPRR